MEGRIAMILWTDYPVSLSSISKKELKMTNSLNTIHVASQGAGPNRNPTGQTSVYSTQKIMGDKSDLIFFSHS
jgi:hypothetical protein